ncbi:MAG: protein kinase domain-containing protein [Gemmatimonadales bacterium]
MSDLAEVLAAALGPQYRLERELGGGGMSRVFVAEEVALGRRVAIKVLPPELAEGITAERFRREIQLAARLQHPHIVPLLSSDRAAGLVFYVMPYVEGESLRERLVRDHTLRPADAVRIGRDVAEALEYAHGHGVVHRDIKPENILLSSSHALVLDFGVAKALRAAVEPGHATTVGVALGTPLYMAPEQAAGGRDVDGRADLYALGVVLYELLAGRPPFESESAYDLMAAHIADPPEPLRRRSAETPAALEAVVMRCLAKRAGERYQTAGELLAELDGFATPAGGVRAARQTRRRRLILAGVAVAAVAGAVAGIRAAGVLGPRTLVAEGVIAEREPVILADFENRTGDSTLGIAVTEAFRIDLAQSSAVVLVPPARIGSALARMRKATAALDLALGREVAQREGIKAVIGGEIAALGGTYVVWAKLINPETGELLAGFRESAGDAARIIRAVDRVSKQLRRRIGESLGRLEAAPRLEQVTTGSLDALRAYSQGVRAVSAGELDRGVTLLEEAVRLDSTFASAYRMLAVAYANWDENRQRQMEAFVEAFRLRDRLPARERDLVTASYYFDVDHRPGLVIRAYESVLREHPTDRVALNNLALLYTLRGQPAKALPLYRRNAEANPGAMTLTNLLEAEFRGGSDAAADSLLGAMQSWDSAGADAEFHRAALASARQQYDSATAAYRRLADSHGDALVWRTSAYEGLANLARLHGRVAESERHQAQAIRAATFHDTTGAEREVRLGLLAARTDLEIRGRFDRGVRRTGAAMRGRALSSIPPLDRPYLDIAYDYAFAGRGDLAQAALDERRRVLEQAGVAGRAALAAHGHDNWYGIVRARTFAANGQIDSAIALLNPPAQPGNDVWSLPHLGALYDAAGRADSAVVIYERFLARRALIRDEVDGWHRPRILYRLGELYEARGDRARAADYYSQFAGLWRDADPELQPRVREARHRLAVLTTEPGTR